MKFDLCIKRSKKSASDKIPRNMNYVKNWTQHLPFWVIIRLFTDPFFFFKVRRARVIENRLQGIYWPPAQGGSGGGRGKFFLALPARFARGIIDVFENNEKKNKTTSVYRLGLYGILPSNFNFGVRHFLIGFKLKLSNFNSK